MRHLAAALLLTLVPQMTTQAPMTHHAHGTFTVDIKSLTSTPADGIARYAINKQIHGDLEATTQGEMFSAGSPQQGNAGYVAIERVTGTLEGKHGSFVLQHFATMDPAGRPMTVVITPGSGTGELTGITGTFTIQITGSQHAYDLTYQLPQ